METFPISLDGNVENAGQGQEGRIAHVEYVQHLRREFDRLWVLNYGQNSPTDEELIAMDVTYAEYPDKRYVEHINRRIRSDELFNKFVNIEASYNRTMQRLMEAQKVPKKHAIHELGAREFTLTYSPKWFDDETARAKMRTAIERLTKYYKDEIVQFRAIGEVGSNGLSHVHCFYKLVGGLKITDKNFKRAWSVWNPKKSLGKSGHEGGHHANVRTESDFLGYIEKDIEDAWLEVNIGGGV